MVAPVVIGAGIAAGASLLGGMMGQEDAEDARHQSWLMNEQNIALQREFAQNGIRWRVKDAEAAGVHPLFALGANPTAFSPTSVSFGSDNHMGKALADAGQHVGRAVAAQETEDQRALRLAQLEAVRASAARDNAAAALSLSEIQRRNQPATPPAFPFGNDTVTGAYASPVTVDGTGHKIESHPLFRDAVKLKPDELQSRSSLNPGLTAGRDHPGMRQFVMPDGFKMLLPATGNGGVPDEIDASMIPSVIGTNLSVYGPRWLVGLFAHWTGQSERNREGYTLESWLRRGREANRRGGPRWYSDK